MVSAVANQTLCRWSQIRRKRDTVRKYGAGCMVHSRNESFNRDSYPTCHCVDAAGTWMVLRNLPPT